MAVAKSRTSTDRNFETGLAHWLGLILLLLVTLAPVSSALGFHLFLKESVIQVVVAISVVGYFLMRPVSSIRFPWHVLTGVAAALLVWGVFSLLWADTPGFGIAHLFRWVTAGTLALAAYQLRRSDSFIVVLRYLFAAGLLVSVFGCLQYLFGLSWVPEARGPAATFVNRNVAMHIVILTWLAGPLLMMLENRRARLRQYVFAVGTSLAIVFATYTQTRAAWIAMCLQVFMIAGFFLFARVRGVQLTGTVHRPALIFAAALLSLLINLGPTGFDPVFSRVSERAGEGLAEVAGTGAQPYERFVIWRSTVEIIKDHPLLGVGIGNFQAVHPGYAVGDTINITYTHNDYLQTVAELGLPGAMAVIAVLSWLAWFGLRTCFTDRDPDLRSVFLLAFLAGIAVDALFSFPLQLVGGTILVGILLGLLLGTSTLRATSERTFSAARPYLALAAFAPIAMVIIALNANWWSVLSRFESETKRAAWTAPIDLSTWVDHPAFVRLVKVLAQRYQSDEPRKAEMVARSYRAIDETNVIVNNTLALALTLQKKFEAADEVISETRPLEPYGYLRSYENEQVLATTSDDTARLRSVFDMMMAMPEQVLTAQPTTLTNLAKTAFNLGEREQALEIINKNVRNAPLHVDAHRTFMLILSRLGRSDEVDGHLERLAAYGLDEAAVLQLQSEFDRR